jgi:hypothetical protein
MYLHMTEGHLLDHVASKPHLTDLVINHFKIEPMEDHDIPHTHTHYHFVQLYQHKSINMRRIAEKEEIMRWGSPLHQRGHSTFCLGSEHSTRSNTMPISMDSSCITSLAHRYTTEDLDSIPYFFWQLHGSWWPTSIGDRNSLRGK